MEINLKGFQQLDVYKVADELVKDVYKLTYALPSNEKFGIVSQLRRAAISIPLNVAEGNGRITKGEYKQFLGQARGSLYELEYLLHISKRIGFLSGC